MKNLTEFNSDERFDLFCWPRIRANVLCDCCPYWIEEREECGHIILSILEKRDITFRREKPKQK